MNAIEFINVSKKFKKGEKFDSLRDLLPNLAKSIFGRNNNNGKLHDKEFWALKDVTFEVKKGEALGIIGPNGAGKSTILKILSRLLKPTSGEIKINGKLSALLEVGAGFHPDLTGRENIYLSASIIGMKKREIDKKIDSIIEFSGLSDFIDTPVKKYSSGMYVRLGFSVSAHMEPDMLLLDEVLAVGDMSFQAKCMDKMNELVNKGVTMIFISHNMHQIEKICDRAILLMRGQYIIGGAVNEVIDIYRSKISVIKKDNKELVGSGEVVVTDVELLDEKGSKITQFKTGESVTVRIGYYCKEKVYNPVFNVALFSTDYRTISSIRSNIDGFEIKELEGDGFIDLKFYSLNLLRDTYIFSVNIYKENGIAFYDRRIKEFSFFVVGDNKGDGICHLPHEWILKN